uniref:Uncharacterized protein n=1 Tax=Arundo donax TaxID=35708 RepID=A0A0A8YZC7_ARUDO
MFLTACLGWVAHIAASGVLHCYGLWFCGKKGMDVDETVVGFDL